MPKEAPPKRPRKDRSADYGEATPRQVAEALLRRWIGRGKPKGKRWLEKPDSVSGQPVS